ncbi:MAG TPA: hypothetical protein VG326_01015 [Tepidisphaeraceae bacterium]|jgi:hypothetical protein|nr:hypothetical protein [Tepidisphaeraceae bacterium]
MDDKKIRAKYGGKLPKAINRAIRAEIPGGNEALDKLTQLAGAARQSQWKDRAGHQTPEAVAYFRHKRDVVDRMDAQVRKKWGVGPAEGAEEKPEREKKPRRTTAAKTPAGTKKRSAPAPRRG